MTNSCALEAVISAWVAVGYFGSMSAIAFFAMRGARQAGSTLSERSLLALVLMLLALWPSQYGHYAGQQALRLHAASRTDGFVCEYQKAGPVIVRRVK